MHRHCVVKQFNKTVDIIFFKKYISEIFRRDDRWDGGPRNPAHLDCDPLMSRDSFAHNDDGGRGQVQGEEGRGRHRTPVGRRKLNREKNNDFNYTPTVSGSWLMLSFDQNNQFSKDYQRQFAILIASQPTKEAYWLMLSFCYCYQIKIGPK